MAIITSDSVNMLSEVATAGLPVLIYPLSGNAANLNIFTMPSKRDLAQDFSQSPRKTFASKLNETERIAHLCAENK